VLTMTEPLIACTTPTLNRPETHESLYQTFVNQDWPNKILLVLDESATPSPFFSRCMDARVQYVHAPSSRGDVTRIGSARNRLCQMARKVGASFVAHMDDDDTYARGYLTRMRERLGSASLVKLAIFRLLVDGGESSGTLWQWDVRSMGGTHYALQGSRTPESVDVPADDDPVYAEAMRFGYGFSYFFRLDVALRFPFPAEGTEDYPWVRTLRENGHRVVEVDDFADGCLHVVHDGSNSMLWPQFYLGKHAPGVGSEPVSLRSFARWRMLGAVSQMYELPQGKDIQVEPGVTYQIVAKIKNNHTLKSVTVRAESWGLVVSGAQDNVNAADLGVKPAPNGYRLVQVMGTSNKSMKVPWKGNKLVSLLDKSSMVRAWSDKAPAAVQINPQLTPAAAGVGSVDFNSPACCKNFAWTSTMGPRVRGHHPSCPKVYRQPSNCYGEIGGDQINWQLSPTLPDGGGGGGGGGGGRSSSPGPSPSPRGVSPAPHGLSRV
jgi:hypothetical protein